MVDQPQQTQAEDQEIEVNKGKITRQSVMEGAWNGMKKGLMWGGIGALIFSGLFGTLAFGAAKGVFTGSIGAAGTGLAAIFAKSSVAGLFAGALALIGITIGGSAVANSLPMMAWELFKMISVAALTVGLPIMAAGALIGGTIGAINGYTASAEKVEMAERQAERDARQAELERQQAVQRQRELASTQAQFDRQTAQIGQFQSPQTPNTLQNNGLDENRAPQPGPREY